jgi:glycosyltransferase involved in cell wall biosynthesis
LVAGVTGAKCVCHVQSPIETPDLRWALRYGADALVTVYRGLLEELRPVLPDNCVGRAIVNGIELDRFRPVSEDEKVGFSQWRFGASRVAVIVGHVSSGKGYPEFVRAAAAVVAEVRDSAFVCLGGESTRTGTIASYVALARSLGVADRVHFVGWQADVRSVVGAADVMVLPSRAEGMPLAVLEAMAIGTPVIASAVNGVPEALEHEVTGFLVPPADADALARAILAAFSDMSRLRRVAASARQKVEREFAATRTVREFDELYQDLLER